MKTIRSISITLLAVLFSLLLFPSVALSQLVDDFFVIETHGGVLKLSPNDQAQCPGYYSWTPASHASLIWWNFSGFISYSLYDPYYVGSDSFSYNCQTSATANVTVLVIGDEDRQNLGSCKRRPKSGPQPTAPENRAHPVNVTNGNMWFGQLDYRLPGRGEIIEIDRFYNSRSDKVGLFGLGWTTKYDVSLAVYDANMVRVDMADGRGVFFGRPNASANYTSISKDVKARIIKEADNSFTMTEQNGSVYKFDTFGNLVWQRDRNGNQTTLGFDVNNNRTVTDPAGRILTMILNPDGTVSQIRDSTGVIADYTYVPGTNRLQSVVYPDGSRFNFEYVQKTVNGQTKFYISSVKDAFDNILEAHEYDNQGRAITSERQGGIEKETFAYNGSYTTVTDALQHETKYYYTRLQGRNVVERVEGTCSCGGSGSETTWYTYNQFGLQDAHLDSIIDALGRTTFFDYDLEGNVTQVWDPLGTQKFTYNAFGDVLTYRDRVDQNNSDPNVNTTTNTYSPTGNLLTTKDRLGNTTTLTYTTLGQLETVKDALNHTTTLTYDTQGRLTQVKDANNKNTTFGYDARARVTSSTNALNETTTYQYDLNNRLKKVTFPDTNYVEFTYDLAGRRTAVKDARGNTTSYAYDAAYRLISITDQLNHTTSYGYDLMSNLTSLTDALGNVTNYQYDDFNRLKKIIYPEATQGATRLEENLTYDKMGNIKTRVDTAGKTTTYDYDNIYRLIKITDPLNQVTQFEYNLRSQMTKVKDALNQEYVFTYDPLGRELTQTRAGSTMSFVYDAVGNRTKRTDYLNRETTYEYDVLNRLTKINYLPTNVPGTLPPPASMPNLSATYNYDDLSRLVSATNNAGTVSFTYDNRNRLKTETDVFGHVTERGYDANGNRTQLKLDGSVHTGYAYDAANRLTTLTDEASQNFTFGYDIANKLISKMMPNAVTSTFDYDLMSRLKELKHQSTTATLTDNDFIYNPQNEIGQIAELTQTRAFTYDDVHRVTGMNNGSSNESYAFDGVGNRNSSHRSATYGYQPFNKLTSTATATYSYDANGNMVSKSEGSKLWSYWWDYENRLVYVSDRKTRQRIIYDALGRRVRSFGGPRGATKYTYDGFDVVMDDNSVSGITKYQNGPGIDNKLKLTNGGDAKYFLQDHLGSTIGLADSSGAVVASASYDSFGNSTNNLTTRYQYTGREYDSFSGLYYYRARWYDSNLGRFISEDPIGFGGGDINFYGYVNNRPVNYSDPNGLFPGDEWWRSKAPENFGQGWRGRMDRFPGGGEGFEIHVYRPGGEEAGIVSGRNGWIAKHGFDATRPGDVPQCVVNKINGLNVAELRARGVIESKGTANIRGGAYLFGGRFLGIMGGAVGVAGFISGLVVDYDVNRRAAENGNSIMDQYQEDNADYPYVMTPLGLMPNYGYRPRA